MKKLKTVIFALLVTTFASSFTDVKLPEQNEVITTAVAKSVSPLQLTQGLFYIVKVKISNASDIKGIAKYEELIPSGYKLIRIHSDYGKVAFDSEKAKVTFLTLNGKDEVNITYYLQADLAVTPIGVAKFQYTDAGKVQRINVELVD